MADYLTIPDSQIDQDKPVTKSLMRALRDNLLAVIAGAPGAPRISPSAIGPFTPGTIVVGNSTAGVGASASDPSYGKVKEIFVPYDGTYNLSVQYSVNSGYGAHAKFYVNGTPVSGDMPTSGTGGTFTASGITVAAGGLVQVYANGGSSPGSAGMTLSNFKIMAAQSLDFTPTL